MGGNRSIRIAESIKREVGTLLLKEIKDVRVKDSLVSVMDVQITNDLRHVTLFFSIWGDSEKKKSVMAGLESAKGYIRSEIGKRINIRFTPEVHLRLDESLEKGDKMLALMNKIKSEEESQNPELTV